MKANRIIAGLLVLLGFAACRPDEVEPPMYGPPPADMYGVPSTRFDVKDNVTENDSGTLNSTALDLKTERE
jgi:hypothetical protein